MQKFEIPVDARRLKVDIGMPVHSPYLPFPTAASLIDTAKLCTERGIKTRLVSPVGCSIVTDARSGVVDEFLKGDATHLFWIDSDIHWHPHSFFRLLALATVVDVVGGTYPLKKDPPQYIVRELGSKLEEYGLVECTGLGLGFVCMKREVVERVAEGKPRLISNGGLRPMREVFELRRLEDGHRVGEDIAFFDDVRALGYKVWLDPMVDLAHVGMKLFQGDLQLAIAAAENHTFDIDADGKVIPSK